MTRQDSVEEMKLDNRGCEEYALSLSLSFFLSLFLTLSLSLLSLFLSLSLSSSRKTHLLEGLHANKLLSTIQT